VSDNYFIVRIDDKINLQSLEYLLKAELNKREINDDFEYGVYDCQSDKMVYGDFVSSTNDNRPSVTFPKLDENDYYFAVYFPEQQNNPIWGLDIWKFTTVLTFLFLLFFGYTMFIILRQKRLSAIQRDFINNITHEFKTPISTLKVASDVLKKGEKIDKERLTKYADLISKETNRLEQHVSKLLNAAVIENKDEIEKGPVNLSLATRDIMDHFQEKFPSVKFISSVEENMKLMSDTYLIELILYNLLDNAVKYGNGVVNLTLSKKENTAILIVQDNGPGIEKKFMKKVFKKFYRIQTGDRHDIKGFGIGLFTVKEAVKKLRGAVDLRVENGSQFIIKLPLK
jgi:two-component system phosphate regulon sensor histidine kinase PhoR